MEAWGQGTLEVKELKQGAGLIHKKEGSLLRTWDIAYLSGELNINGVAGLVAVSLTMLCNCVYGAGSNPTVVMPFLATVWPVVSFGPHPASYTHLFVKGRIVTHKLDPLGRIHHICLYKLLCLHVPFSSPPHHRCWYISYLRRVNMK